MSRYDFGVLVLIPGQLPQALPPKSTDLVSSRRQSRNYPPEEKCVLYPFVKMIIFPRQAVAMGVPARTVIYGRGRGAATNRLFRRAGGHPPVTGIHKYGLTHSLCHRIQHRHSSMYGVEFFVSASSRPVRNSRNRCMLSSRTTSLVKCNCFIGSLSQRTTGG